MISGYGFDQNKAIGLFLFFQSLIPNPRPAIQYPDRPIPRKRIGVIYLGKMLRQI